MKKRTWGKIKTKNKIRLYSLHIYLKYSCRIPATIFRLSSYTACFYNLSDLFNIYTFSFR